MRRSILIIPALAGALGAAAPAFAQSDDVLGDEEYPADDYAAAPAEEYAGEDVGSSTYDDVDSYADDTSYTDDTGYEDNSAYDDTYADRTVDPATFRSALSPYGRWVNTPEYGQVWIPSSSVVGSNFIPYTTAGNWRNSSAGWTFVSDYSWGWAPFHYGRWYRAPRLGWVWVPGRTWGPAWVDWRYGDGYIGWAPLPPRRYASWLRRHDYWFFCSVRNWWRPNVWRYRVRSTPRMFQVAVLARRPVRHGRARWFAGPNARVVERVAGHRFERVQLRPNRHERVTRRVDRRVDRRQNLPRQQRVQQQRVQQQRVQQQRQTQVREQRQNQVRAQRQNQMREQRQQQQRAQRQTQVRAQRQNQVREQRQQQRAQRQTQVREQRQQQRAQRQQARQQRQQPSREHRRRPDR